MSLNETELSENESCISFEDGSLHIEGSDTFSTINAISIFIDHIVHSCDKKEDGSYHIYFPKNQVISDEWDFAIPIFPGGSFVSSECISNENYSLIFRDVQESDYRNYLEIIKLLGFVPQSSTDNISSASSSFIKGKTFAMISYSAQEGSISIYLSGKALKQ